MVTTEAEKAAAVASAAGPGVVVVGPRTFVLSPPAVEDYGALLKEMRRQVMAGGGDPLDAVNERISRAEKAGRPYSPTTINAMMTVALAAGTSKEQKAEPTSEQLYAQMQTADGLRWWCWYLLRKADASVTPADVLEWVPDDAAAFRVSAELSRLSEHRAISPK